MSAGARLAAFAVALGVLFAGGTVVGAAVGPLDTGDPAGSGHDGGHGTVDTTDTHEGREHDAPTTTVPRTTAPAPTTTAPPPPPPTTAAAIADEGPADAEGDVEAGGAGPAAVAPTGTAPPATAPPATTTTTRRTPTTTVGTTTTTHPPGHGEGAP